MPNRKLRFSYTPYTLHFKEPGGTSRGILTDKLTYLIKVESKDDPTVAAFGEVPVFPGLSHESIEEVEEALENLIRIDNTDDIKEIKSISSLVFGLEQALNTLKHRGNLAFPSSFTSGHDSIIINGLIWMGDFNKMKERVLEKVNAGFRCIKIKIAAIRWEEELQLLRFIRDLAGNDVTIRLDANGGFEPDDCMRRLEDLEKFNIHSIEQPIKPAQYEAMRRICKNSPIPIALDEELIGLPPGDIRSQILEYIRPSFIILKPALCYGFSGAEDWIKRVSNLQMGYWITSALESSVGLNAIAQFTGALHPEIPQGLGTGNLYTNNFTSPLNLQGQSLSYSPLSESYNSELEKLEWKTI